MSKKLEKVIRNGKVAVLYSPGYGAGWYSWNQDHKELLFHPKLVELVEKGDFTEFEIKELTQKIIDEDVYCGGATDLTIEWVPEGSRFDIEEYEGNESVKVYGPDDGIVA